MPEPIESYAARIHDAQEAGGGRLGLAEGMTDWDIFPFEASDLGVRPVGPLSEADPARHGEDPATCPVGDCPREERGDWRVVWTDEHWRVKAAPPSGSPLVLILETRAHLDFTELTDDLAGELGRLSVCLARLVEELPSAGRCHVMRIGDGGVHCHVWFFARPARMPQLLGSFMVVWDDLLPPVPVEVRDENAAFVVDRLVATYGGERVG